MSTLPISFEEMLTGGHLNSLGRTIEVVDIVLADSDRIDELYQCYFSDDEVVRLRTSNAMKRVCQQHPDWLIPYLNRFLTEISNINQPSAQWTLAQLFQQLAGFMTESQFQEAVKVLKHNLQQYDDWIVLNHTMQTLADWAKEDDLLRVWLQPHIERLSTDNRKSVANRARKLNKELKKASL